MNAPLDKQTIDQAATNVKAAQDKLNAEKMAWGKFNMAPLSNPPPDGIANCDRPANGFLTRPTPLMSAHKLT